MVSGLRPEFVVMLYGSDQRPGMVYSRAVTCKTVFYALLFDMIDLGDSHTDIQTVSEKKIKFVFILKQSEICSIQF